MRSTVRDKQAQMFLAGKEADRDGPTESGKELCRGTPQPGDSTSQPELAILSADFLLKSNSLCIISRRLLRAQTRPGPMSAFPGLQVPHPPDRTVSLAEGLLAISGMIENLMAYPEV